MADVVAAGEVPLGGQHDFDAMHVRWRTAGRS
jgi:hypothetical protein